jgi:hypothetical protein
MMNIIPSSAATGMAIERNSGISVLPAGQVLATRASFFHPMKFFSPNEIWTITLLLLSFRRRVPSKFLFKLIVIGPLVFGLLPESPVI